jgi:hypothetical protein
MIVTTLALGLRPRQRHRKVQAESATQESHSHFWSVRKCEGMSPHIPKWTPTLGIKIPMESQIFKEQLEGLILIGLKTSLYH